MDNLRFALGGSDKLNIEHIRGILLSQGHSVVCEDDDGPSLLRSVRSLIPDFVIASYELPGMKGPEIARIIEGDRLAPVLLIAENSEDMPEARIGSENFAFLIKPVSEVQLMTTVEYVYGNYRRVCELEEEVSKLRETIDSRRIVERAKGILMDRYDMKEKDAFRYIQKRSMDECKRASDIAKQIVEKYQKK